MAKKFDYDVALITEIATKTVISVLQELQMEEEPEQEEYVSAESIKAYKMFEDYPNVLTAPIIAAMLQISKYKAYELLHAKGCPVLVMGRSRRVNKESFLNWLKEREGGYLLEPGEGYYSRNKDYDNE